MKSYRTHRATMIVVVYGVLLFFGFAQKPVNCTEWVDDLTKYVSESSVFKQVRIMTRLDENERFDSPVIDELFGKLIQTVPTLTINFDENFKLPAQSVIDDTSATLFILVIESPNGLPTNKTKRCLDVMGDMAKKHYAPKYLIASFVQTPSRNIEELLQSAWEEKRMLQTTIVELVEPKVARTSILVERPVMLPTTYQLNPFKKELTHQNWTADVKTLYPDKVRNMSGYPVQMSTPGFATPTEISQANDLVIDIIEQQLRFSSEKTFPLLVDFFLQYPQFKAISEMIVNKADLMIDLYQPYDTMVASFKKTTTVKMDKSYFLVPIFSKSETFLSTNFLWACGLSFGIVIVFWIFTRLLGFDSNSWKILDIVWILFGFSVNHQPRGNVERIVFATLLTIFAFYSSELYASLTEVTMQRTIETKFETLDDLFDSTLRFNVRTEDFSRVDDVFNQELGNRSTEIDDFIRPTACVRVLLEGKNVTCLVSKMLADRYISTTVESGRPVMKIAEPAMWTEIYSFIVDDRSPYLPNFDKIIMKLQSIGVIQKIYYDEWKLEKMNDLPVDPSDAETLLKHVLYLVAFGYSLSFVVLIIEIVYHRISMYRKSKRLVGLFPIRNKIRPKTDEFSVLTDVKNIYKAFCKK